MSNRSGHGYDFRVPAYVHYLHSVGSLVMSMILTLWQHINVRSLFVASPWHIYNIKSHCFGQRFYCLHSSETLLGRLQCPLLALVPLCPPRSFALGKYCGGSLAMSSRSGHGYDFRVPAHVHCLHSSWVACNVHVLSLWQHINVRSLFVASPWHIYMVDLLISNLIILYYCDVFICHKKIALLAMLGKLFYYCDIFI